MAETIIKKMQYQTQFVFSEQFTKKHYQKLPSQIKKKIRYEKIWPLILSQDLLMVLPHIKQAFCQTLSLSSTFKKIEKPSSILALCSNTHYACLKCLDLSYIRIVNIEGLSWLNMEKLETLNVKSNNICNFKAINKTNWKNLKNLCIEQNKGSEVHLSRTRTSKGLEILEWNHFNWIQKEDLRNLVKLEVESLNYINLSKIKFVIVSGEKQKLKNNTLLALDD